MVDIICMGNPPKATIKFTIPEGLSVEGIADKLVALGLLQDTTDFLALCKSGEDFGQYSFVTSILSGEDAKDRDYVLEGYLFRILMRFMRMPLRKPSSPRCSSALTKCLTMIVSPGPKN